MKKLRTFAVSMIVAALGLLIYCAGFYIKSYEQNLAARQEYADSFGVKHSVILLSISQMCRLWKIYVNIGNQIRL